MKHKYHYLSKFCRGYIYTNIELTPRANYKLGKKLYNRIHESNTNTINIRNILITLIKEVSLCHYSSHEIFLYNKPEFLDAIKYAKIAYKKDVKLLMNPMSIKPLEISVNTNIYSEYSNLSEFFQKNICLLEVISDCAHRYGKYIYDEIHKYKGHHDSDGIVIDIFRMVLVEILAFPPDDEDLLDKLEDELDIPKMKNLLINAYAKDLKYKKSYLNTNSS